MNSSEVAAVINDCHYKPGWTLRAFADGELGVVMVVTATAPNSNQDNALKGYPEVIQPSGEAYALTWMFRTHEDVHAWVLETLIKMETHEAREFFRVGADMRAPFHPHRPEGNAAWGNRHDTRPAFV